MAMVSFFFCLLEFLRKNTRNGTNERVFGRTNWLVMILAGVAFAFVAIVKETYGPTLLRKRAAKLRKETGDPRWWSRFDEKQAFFPLLKVNLSRPFVLMVTEPIW
jgi:hypothetical protein